jgi:hypothetical protein
LCYDDGPGGGRGGLVGGTSEVPSSMFLAQALLGSVPGSCLKDSYFMKQITWLIYGSVLSLHYGLLVFIRVQCFVFDGEDVRYI